MYLQKDEILMSFVSYVIKERMVQLQDAQKEAEVTSEVTERELELEAQLVEARSIIQEQVSSFFSPMVLIDFFCISSCKVIVSFLFLKRHQKSAQICDIYEAESPTFWFCFKC